MKKVLVVLGALVGVIVLGAVAAVLLVDLNPHKPRIEKAVSDALGMEFGIRGNVDLRLLPPAGVSLSGIRLSNRGTEVADVGTVRVGVKLLPLLHRNVEISEVLLEKPVIRVEKMEDGRFNFETGPSPRKTPAATGEEAPAAPVSVARADVKDGRFLYVDRKEGTRVEISGVDLALRDFRFSGGPKSPPQKAVRFSGKLGVKSLKAGDLTVSDVQADVSASDGIFDVRPFVMKLFGGKGAGEIRADLSGKEPVLNVKYALTNFRAEESLAAVSKKKSLSGPLTLREDLTLRGAGADALKRTATGTVSLRGENLALEGMDIDSVASKVEQARDTNLADVGAFLLAGPLGTAATKGVQVGSASLAVAAGGRTDLTRLVSDWTVRNGVAEADDVAFSTRKTRIALKGRLDIVNERFLGVDVAVLDAKGCAKMHQKIDGPFRNPRMDKVSTLESVAKPILGLFKETKRFLGETSCKPFYAGSVPQP